MMPRKKRTKCYKRFDCIAAIEGPCDPAMVISALRNSEVAADLPVKGGPYTGLPLEEVEGEIAVVCRKDMPVLVYNGRTHLRQKLFCIYRRNGTICRDEAEQLEASGAYEIDFLGTFKFIRDNDGVPIGRTTRGRVNRHLRQGELLFVRADTFEGLPVVPYTVCSFDDNPPYTLKVPLKAQQRDGSVDLSGTHIVVSQTALDGTPVVLDAATGEMTDAIMPDGALTFGVGRHDHIVLAIHDDLGGEQVLKGTKAEMLEQPNGILARLQKAMPGKTELVEKVSATVREFDPSSGVMLVTVASHREKEIDVKMIPYTLFPEAT